MVLKLFSVAVLAVLAGVGVAGAQSANDFGGPRELPPASFTGQQYVDSRGCVFLRAGLSGQTNWVPRVNRNRQPLCGYPPTFGNNQVAIVEPAPRAAPAPAAAPTARRAPSPAPAPTVASRRPMDTVASTTTPPRIRAQQGQQSIAPSTYVPPPVGAPQRAADAPKAAAPAQQRSQPAERSRSVAGNRKIGCYRDAPVAERFALQGGGTVVLCTRGDGDIANARPPRLVTGAAAVAPSGYLEGPDPAKSVGIAAAPQEQPVVPKGYKPAFEDDRLNPNRGVGTREGWAQQDQVWTREVPARLVEERPKPPRQAAASGPVHASTKSEPAPQKAAGQGSYVQVGTFGQPANAEGASRRLAGLGLPVAKSRISRNGKPLQIVLAGPFASTAEARAALSAARGAGFGDAFIR